MKILTEASSSVAWCLHRSGRSIPVKVHPFGALDDDAIEDAAWLYVVEDDFCKHHDLVRFIANQICLDYGVDASWSSISLIQLVGEDLEDIECIKGMPRASDLIDAVGKYAISMLDEANENADCINNMSQTDVEETGSVIKSHLNENYLRVRWGSEYQNFTERAGAIYFRTSSSDGFNWYPLIIKFLEQLPASRKVKEVTIERDQSSTGDNLVYVNHMPLNEFLLNKPIVVESIIKCGTIKENTDE